MSRKIQLLVVEAPTKCKTIQKYIQEDGLGGAIPNGIVLATKGHIRNIAAKTNAIIQNNQINLVWEDKNEENIKKIVQNSLSSEKIYIATDLDREGETIGWHVAHFIFKSNPQAEIYRIRFNAVTKEALKEAIKNAEKINLDYDYPNDSKNALVKACLARYSLDHLYGFRVSGILMRKLRTVPLPAGRVKTPTLGIVFHREKEIRFFQSQEYYDIVIKGQLEKKEVSLELHKVYNKSVKAPHRFSQQEAKDLLEYIKSTAESGGFPWIDTEKTMVKRSPAAPFTTSTLQQSSSSKLGFSVKRTMDVAKSLYEGVECQGKNIGLITYIRTDSIFIEPNAVEQIRNFIDKNFSKDYLPGKSRNYKQKKKNTQEAHEAIRPTEISITPESIQGKIKEDEWKLYNLIWKRTVASQMADSNTKRINYYFSKDPKELVLVYKESIITFKGYREIYEDDDDTEEENTSLSIGEKSQLSNIIVNSEQKFTQPPGRLSEAGIVKKMEDEGIGRPSTIAGMIGSLFTYAFCEKKGLSVQILPKGVLVYMFLSSFFSEYVTSQFTATMENNLDDIINGKTDWKNLVLNFFMKLEEQAVEIEKEQGSFLVEKIQEDFFKFFSITNICPHCNSTLKLITYRGVFIGCNNYPNCKYVRSVEEKTTVPGITIKNSKYGWYVEKVKDDGTLQRSSIPNFIDSNSVDQSKAEILLQYPYVVGIHEDSEIVVDKNRFYLFVQWKDKKIKIPSKYIWNKCSLDEIRDIIHGKDIGIQSNNSPDERKKDEKKKSRKKLSE